MWLKPCGLSLFTFSEKTNMWRQFFRDINGEILIWNSTEFSGDSIIDFIKECEEGFKSLFLNSNFELSSTYEDLL